MTTRQERYAAALEYDATARHYLGTQPTQGKCDPCGRFYLFAGPLHRQDCPICGRKLARTSIESVLPRFLLTHSRKGWITEDLDKLVRERKARTT